MKKSAYSIKEKLSSLFMVLALVWLTVSLPFVYEAQQKTSSETELNSSASSQNEDCNPLANTTEEKAPSTTTLSEEYLHDSEGHQRLLNDKLSHFYQHNYDVYIAFHGELISPPPDDI